MLVLLLRDMALDAAWPFGLGPATPTAQLPGAQVCPVDAEANSASHALHHRGRGAAAHQPITPRLLVFSRALLLPCMPTRRAHSFSRTNRARRGRSIRSIRSITAFGKMTYHILRFHLKRLLCYATTSHLRHEGKFDLNASDIET